ncbi:hypothetical protein OH76DRAFT_1410731 [Lentinus brumalis]|uniref:RING-type domain-containing protein n=1 Tax=Lentinus brumalis TaxID=2498619 RepID=A0A371CRE4_9APHY|nr:hypothetical protein OH76DRAFT_1410731 [Polyporus brumalis]
MSSPVRTLGPVQTANATVNTRKRVLTDSEDTEERDSKRVKPQEEQADLSKRRDAKGKDKERKKKRKKKRKVPVVQGDSSDAETPAPVHNAKSSRLRSRSIVEAGPSTINGAHLPKVEESEARLPSAGPPRASVARTSSATPDVTAAQHPLQDQGRATSDSAWTLPAPLPRNVKEEASIPTIPPSADKGKARATSDGAETSSAEVQVTELQVQISAKSQLVTEHEGLVSTLQQSLSCQICLDLMHRPFALSPCGHSACHQCLVNWFKAPPADVPANQVLPTWLRKKTCPHCRAVVKDRPLEIWAIKEMVANLVKSGLAQGFYSPAEEPAAGAANADPWTGIFRPEPGNQHAFPDGAYPAPVAHLLGQRDDEDGVYRCIDCFHEIAAGSCSHCGRVYPGHDPEHDLDYDDDDDSVHDLWRDEAEHVWGGHQALNLDDRFAFFDIMPHPFAPAFHPRVVLSDDEDGSFDWDAGGDTEIESDGEAAQVNWRRRLPQAGHIEELDDDDEGDGENEDGYESSFIDDGEAAVPPAPLPLRNSRSPPHLDREATIELSDDDDDEVQFIGRRRNLGRGRGPIVVDSDEDDEDITIEVHVDGYAHEHDGGASDEDRSYRSMSDHGHVEYGSDEE